jgi:hypothetical protein
MYFCERLLIFGCLLFIVYCGGRAGSVASCALHPCMEHEDILGNDPRSEEGIVSGH